MTAATLTSSPDARPATTVLPRRPSLVAGIALLLMSVLGGVGNFVAVEALVTPGDALRTAADVAASETLFRLGIVALLGVVVLDVVVALALYRVFRSVDAAMSQLGAWLRLTYAAVFAAAISHLLGAARAASDSVAGGADGQRSAEQALLAVEAFGDLWDAGLVLFGLHLIALGWLLHRSAAAPRVLAPLLVLAGAGYVADSLIAVLTGDSRPVVSTVTFVGEFVLAVWLVARAGRPSHARPTGLE